MTSLPNQPSTRWEVFVGRSLAIGVHPVAAWVTGSSVVRLHCTVVYFTFSYVLALGTLLVLGH
jgi:hypothetical protein